MITIIVPLYNKEESIERTILSVLNQTYSNYELIIVDDGSTDNSAKIIKSFHDERVKYYYKSNTGVSETRNYGLSKASGDWILYLDADDYLCKDALNYYADAVMKYSSCVDVIVSSFYVKNNKSIILRETTKEGVLTNPLKEYWKGVFFSRTGNTLMSINAALSISHFDKRMSYNEDFAVVIKTLLNYKVAVIKEPTMVYTDDYNTLSLKKTNVQSEFIFYASSISLENKYIRLLMYEHYSYSLRRRLEMNDESGYLYIKSNFNKEYSTFDKLRCNIMVKLKRMHKRFGL